MSEFLVHHDIVPTPAKTTIPLVVGKTGPGILVCKNGKPVGVGGCL